MCAQRDLTVVVASPSGEAVLNSGLPGPPRWAGPEPDNPACVPVLHSGLALTRCTVTAASNNSKAPRNFSVKHGSFQARSWSKACPVQDSLSAFPPSSASLHARALLCDQYRANTPQLPSSGIFSGARVRLYRLNALRVDRRTAIELSAACGQGRATDPAAVAVQGVATDFLNTSPRGAVLGVSLKGPLAAPDVGQGHGVVMKMMDACAQIKKCVFTTEYEEPGVHLALERTALCAHSVPQKSNSSQEFAGENHPAIRQLKRQFP